MKKYIFFIRKFIMLCSGKCYTVAVRCNRRRRPPMKSRNTLMQRIAALALAGMAVTYYKKKTR